MSWIFLPLDGSANRDNFDCGNSDLNEYLKKYARQNHRKGIATTFIAIPEAEIRNVDGKNGLVGVKHSGGQCG